MVVGAKLKLGFIDGSSPKPVVIDNNYQRWIRGDYMVTCWILNSMISELSNSFLYAQYAFDIWKKLKERYGQINGPFIYHIERELSKVSQELGFLIGTKAKKGVKMAAQLSTDFDQYLQRIHHFEMDYENEVTSVNMKLDQKDILTGLSFHASIKFLSDRADLNIEIKWVVETRALDHMCPHLDLFQRIKILKKPIKINLPCYFLSYLVSVSGPLTRQVLAAGEGFHTHYNYKPSLPKPLPDSFLVLSSFVNKVVHNKSNDVTVNLFHSRLGDTSVSKLIHVHDFTDRIAIAVSSLPEAMLQHVVALSNTEAEYMDLTEAVKKAIWLRRLLEEEVLKAKTVKVLKVVTEHNVANALMKVAEGQSVSNHVLLMKRYLDQLATLSYAFPDKVSISFILNLLSSEFQAIVQNYNMQSMEKTISEVHSLLIEFEKSIKRNTQPIIGASCTPQVMAIQSGRVQKYKPQGGHWKRNCPVYLAELMKMKKKTRGQNVASTSSDFGLSVSMNNKLYFDAIIVNGIYEIDMRDSTLSIVNSMYSISNKRTKSNLDSTYLWHCRLANINKKRIEKLHDVLKSTDNEPFDQCVSCISGKMTRKTFSHKTKKVKDVLGLIHTDVCGPLGHVSKKGASYFITFTYDFSRYGYVYLLKHKHEVFETFKVWGYEAHVKCQTPNKLQQRSVKCIFVGYPKETMGYYFYYPPENKIVVERYADFLENDFILQKENGRIVKLKDEDILPSENTSEHPIEEESLAPIVSQEEDVILVRRSVRTHKAPDRLCLNKEIDSDRLCFNVEVEEHSLGDLNEHANYKAALSDPEFEKWLVAMNAEMQSMYDNKKVCKLQRSIYGLQQVSRNWNKRFDEEIKKFGFHQNLDEPCVYQKASGSNVIFLILYVDDIILMGNHIPSLQEVKTYLGKCFSMKDLEETAFILGIKIYRDRSRRLIGLSQNAYLHKILKRYRMDNSKRGFIPMQVDLHLRSIMYDVRNTKDTFLVYGGDPEAELRVTVIAMLDSKPIEMTRNLKLAAKEDFWIRKFIDELGVVPSNDYPIKMNYDNSATITMAKESGIQKVARHFKKISLCP
uniref:Retrotransposon protein, putative, Ty1-copia subclass n=1 Tax=Tanacetum cinerariifolium TaxID=118510 RepID=A0A6L2JZ57_TANCI|nr:hypothetical protein [Tanacetum cinerariifolium]